MDALLIALFVVASIGGTALIAYAIRAGHKAKAALEAMARDNGWQFSYQPSAGGRGSRTIISDPTEGWTYTMYFHSTRTGSSGPSGSTTRWTQFEAPDLPVEGLAVLGPDIPEKTKKMADKMLGMMGGDLGLFLLNKITGGLGEETQSLRTVEGPGPGTLMTTPEATTALDDLRYAPELNSARAGK
ncbi:MAG: hypothetical protein AAGP08_08645, partial [Pseudomonadota bacterium]